MKKLIITENGTVQDQGGKGVFIQPWAGNLSITDGLCELLYVALGWPGLALAGSRGAVFHTDFSRPYVLRNNDASAQSEWACGRDDGAPITRCRGRKEAKEDQSDDESSRVRRV